MLDPAPANPPPPQLYELPYFDVWLSDHWFSGKTRLACPTNLKTVYKPTQELNKPPLPLACECKMEGNVIKHFSGHDAFSAFGFLAQIVTKTRFRLEGPIS